MDASSAPKRRKTSPTTSVPVESTTPAGPPPQEGQQQEERQSSHSRSPQRPSSASPKRSSLARHSSEVLLREQEPAQQGDDNIPASEPNQPDDDVDIDDALTAQLEHRSEGHRTASPPDVAGSSLQNNTRTTRSASRASPGDDTGSAPYAAVPSSQNIPRTTRSASRESPEDVPRSPSRKIGGSTFGAHPARRTPTRPQPRPLPPPGPEEEEIIANPFERRGLYRSPLNTGVLPAVVYEEPELPPTPEHPDPVVSTPPSGIHNTPSKRRRELSERDAMRQQSSPSKHPLAQEVSGPSAPPQKESQKATGGRSASPVKIVGGTLTLPERSKEKDSSIPEPRSEFAIGTHPRRSVRLRGPNWKKEQERDALLKEVAQLEADLELAKRANNDAAKGLPLANEDEVLDVLRRRLVPAEQETDADASASTEWLDTVMDPIAMLGFNGFSGIHLPPAIPHQSAEDEPEPPIISHHPIPMNASEELPFLQVLTPLTFSSSVVTISPSADADDQTTFQKHTINIRSASPPGLFTARIEMAVNTRTKTVSSLSVPGLDPAAAGELKPFFHTILSPDAEYHAVKTRNVNLLCWAMGEWYGIALKRAKFWLSLETALDSKEGLFELARSTRARKRTKRRRQEQASDADSGVGESFAADSDGDPKLFSKARLLPHMGRTSMDFEIPYLKTENGDEMSELRVKWTIEFDWAGEARSKLGVELGVPGKWQAIDERKSLVGIPKMFDKLLQGGEDPLTAVKTVVALLAGEPGV